jgi:hypothetical protein
MTPAQLAMKDGRLLAQLVLPAIEIYSESPVDHVAWWAGFLSTMAGYAVGDIGAEALTVVGDSIGRAVAKVTK